jgi:hypothetical protein
MHDGSCINNVLFELFDLEEKNHVNQINKLVIIYLKTRILEFTKDNHVWFI